jgi:hypothetical protein
MWIILVIPDVALKELVHAVHHSLTMTVSDFWIDME